MENIKVEFARYVVEVICKNGFDARFAGGCVRDKLLGKQPLDYDIATTATPNELSNIFASTNIQIINTGIEHGTLTLMRNLNKVEVTTLRKDVKTDGRHAQVEFTKDFKLDASRRDFTINAMYEDLEGRVYDYFEGEKDLTNKVLRFVGEPGQRIKEDYLRILRFYRFWAKLGFSPELTSREACRNNLSGLNQISGERIRSEVVHIYGCPKIQHINQALYEDGVYQVIFHTSIIDDFIEKTINIDNFINNNFVFLNRLALVFFSLDQKSLTTLYKILKLSRQEKNYIDILFQFPNKLAEVIKNNKLSSSLFYLEEIEKKLNLTLNIDDFLGALNVIYRQNQGVQKNLKIWQKHLKVCAEKRFTKLPIDGELLKQRLGLYDGIKIGLVLKGLRENYYNGTWNLNLDEGILFANEIANMKKS